MFVIFNLFLGLTFLINNNHVKKNKLILNNRNIVLSINNKFNFSNHDNNNKSLANKNNLDDNFPSFYKFIKQRKLVEDLEKYDTSKENKKYFMESSSKDLKLLEDISAIQWARKWIYEMIHFQYDFPKFMFQDMYRMRDFGEKNTSKNFFYIGYFPPDSNLKQGPYYIGAFELLVKDRSFVTHLIIQNPHYFLDDKYDNCKIIDFKKELIAMTNDANVFFKYANLKNSFDQRYYYSWVYEDSDSDSD